jgi:hypothetical protein
MSVSGVAHVQGEPPAAVFYPFVHPTPCAYGTLRFEISLYTYSNGGEHLLLVSQEGGSGFVQFRDVVHDEEDVSLSSGVGGFHSDNRRLLGAVIWEAQQVLVNSMIRGTMLKKNIAN